MKPKKPAAADDHEARLIWAGFFSDCLQTFHARLPLGKDATEADLERVEAAAERQANRMLARWKKRFGG